MRAAASMGHPLASNEKVRERMRQYQDVGSGAVANFIGEDAAKPEWPGEIAAGDVAFFGEYALADRDYRAAEAAGSWLLTLVDQNRSHMRGGSLYCSRTLDGALFTQFPADAEFRTNSLDRSHQSSRLGGRLRSCIPH